MQLNQKLINDLREGKIVLRNKPKNPEAVKAITGVSNFSGNGNYYFWDKEDSQFYSAGFSFPVPDLPQVPIADFLRPEPRFKVGDKVIMGGVVAVVDSMQWDSISGRSERWFYGLQGIPGTFAGDLLSPAPETATKSTTEQQFEIGKSYSFTDRDGIEWKGKLLNFIDHKYKYIALIDGSDIPAAFDQIKTIQPRKVSRWINVCPDGRVLRKSYETEQEAKGKSCQGGMHDCKQVKLEGVIL